MKIYTIFFAVLINLVYGNILPPYYNLQNDVLVNSIAPKVYVPASDKLYYSNPDNREEIDDKVVHNLKNHYSRKARHVSENPDSITFNTKNSPQGNLTPRPENTNYPVQRPETGAIERGMQNGLQNGYNRNLIEGGAGASFGGRIGAGFASDGLGGLHGQYGGAGHLGGGAGGRIGNFGARANAGAGGGFSGGFDFGGVPSYGGGPGYGGYNGYNNYGGYYGYDRGYYYK